MTPRLRIPALRTTTGLRRSPLIAGESGTSSIEFAVVLSGSMLFIFTLMQLCMAFYAYGMISEVARETTRWASVRGATCTTSSGSSCTTTTTAITAYANAIDYPNIGGGAMNITPSFPDGDEAIGHRVEVTISYTVPITLPLVPKNSITLHTASEMYFLQ